MNNKKILLPLMFLAMFFWGTSWPSSKIMLEYAPAYIISFWRFFFVLLASLVLMFMLKISFKVDRHSLFFIIITGFCNSLYSLLQFTGLQTGFAGKGGVLVTTSIPIFSYILMQILRHIEAKKRKIKLKKRPKSELLGLCLGIFSGLCLLNLTNFNELLNPSNMYFISAAITWVLLSLFSKNIKSHPLALNCYVTLVSVLCFCPVLLLEKTFFIFNADFRFYFSMFLVAFLSTTIGTGIYFYGIRYLGLVKANIFQLLVPPCALIMSFFILGEKPTVLTVVGTALALLAIYFINIYKKKPYKK